MTLYFAFFPLVSLNFSFALVFQAFSPFYKAIIVADDSQKAQSWSKQTASGAELAVQKYMLANIVSFRVVHFPYIYCKLIILKTMTQISFELFIMRFSNSKSVDVMCEREVAPAHLFVWNKKCFKKATSEQKQTN